VSLSLHVPRRTHAPAGSCTHQRTRESLRVNAVPLSLRSPDRAPRGDRCGRDHPRRDSRRVCARAPPRGAAATHRVRGTVTPRGAYDGPWSATCARSPRHSQRLTLVLHAPLQLDHHGLARELIEERLGVDLPARRARRRKRDSQVDGGRGREIGLFCAQKRPANARTADIPPCCAEYTSL
jgi:hypothetical protein